MAVTDIYKLPWPELPTPADAPGGFQALAEAVENHAFPSLQASGQGGWIGNSIVLSGSRYTTATVAIPSAGIVGWVDIDADGIISAAPGVGAAGQFEIYVNGANARSVRYHNWWRGELVSLYNSVRINNVNGLALSVQVSLYVDVPSSQIRFNCENWGWQVYGKKVT